MAMLGCCQESFVETLVELVILWLGMNNLSRNIVSTSIQAFYDCKRFGVVGLSLSTISKALWLSEPLLVLNVFAEGGKVTI